MPDETRKISLHARINRSARGMLAVLGELPGGAVRDEALQALKQCWGLAIMAAPLELDGPGQAVLPGIVATGNAGGPAA